jgi:hypothetical protein
MILVAEHVDEVRPDEPGATSDEHALTAAPVDGHCRSSDLLRAVHPV